MNHQSIRCPSCGSGQIVPAENERYYCKSCDGLFEEAQAAKSAGSPPRVRSKRAGRLEPKPDRTAFLLNTLVALVVVGILLAMIFLR